MEINEITRSIDALNDKVGGRLHDIEKRLADFEAAQIEAEQAKHEPQKSAYDMDFEVKKSLGNDIKDFKMTVPQKIALDTPALFPEGINLIGGINVRDNLCLPRTPFLDAISKISIQESTVVQLNWNFDSNAAVVPERQEKPEAGAPEWESYPLVTIAEYKGITRQLGADAPVLVSDMMRKMINDLRVTTERSFFMDTPPQGLNTLNDHVGQFLDANTGTSIMSESVLFAQSQIAANGGNGRIIATSSDIAKLLMREIVNEPSVADLLGIGGNGLYASNAVILPVLVDNGINGQGCFVIDPDAVTLAVKGDVETYRTDSHANNFVKNILTFLAEWRVQYVFNCYNRIACF